MNHNNRTSNVVPLLAYLLISWAVILIPFRIIGHGFLPPDDAMRHSAKVISGKDWSDILILRNGIKIDSHPGWHVILGIVRDMTHWDAHSLVLFSVISLFILFCLTPLVFMRYPEAWVMALITLAIAIPGWLFRLLLGRPYIFTMACLLAFSFLWPKLNDKKISYKTIAILTILVALSTWIHAGWYLFALPVIALLLARRWRAGFLFAICCISGVSIGAAFTGHPLLFVKQTLLHLTLAFGSHDMQHMLVTEFRAGFAEFNVISLVGGILIWRALCNKWKKDIIDNPLFILAALTFVSGFVTKRVWIDWGVPVMAVWIAQNFEELITMKIDILSWRRLMLTIPLAVVLYLSITTDAGSRWTAYKPVDYLIAEDAEEAWLPGPGGIIYSDRMDVFYQTFFKNPCVDWKYILGFEPAIMPEEDLVIYRNIQRDPGTYKPFDPWVRKMRPEDRLIIRGNSKNKPEIPELEWYYAARGTWIGRKPK